jgi:hypothetical protein
MDRLLCALSDINAWPRALRRSDVLGRRKKPP